MQIPTVRVLDAIRTRRSVAHFTKDPVPAEVIAELLEAAVHVPNHRLTEPWTLQTPAVIVFTSAGHADPELRALLALSPGHRIIGAVYAGYPESVPEKKRTPASEKTVWLP